MLKLRDGDLYESKETGRVYELCLDYDGYSWFVFSKRDGEGVIKTFSMSYEEMEGLLAKYYKKVKKQKVGEMSV